MNTLLGSLSLGTILVIVLGSVVVLYLARNSAHQAISSLFRMLYTGLRFGAVTTRRTSERLHARNREVLLNLGREQTERDLEKEFFEISKFVQRDLGGYPQLQKQIQQHITQIQDDYAKSGDVPQASPDWVEAIEAVAHLKANEKTPAINVKILEQIHKSAEQQHAENLKTYRQETSNRHRILKAMTPYWRKLAYSVDEVGGRLKEIVTRSKNIDAHMARYDAIVAGTDSAERSLKASAITQFLIALIVIVIAVGGAFFNFHLIALPMSEMVGSVQRIAGVKVADLAALVIICLEMTAGIFLLESLRITKLFPLIGAMDDRIRRIILISAATVLIVLACTESALAFMRDQIAADLAALRASLAGTPGESSHVGGVNQWIPLAANMTLGFILPLALTMVAVPLEYLLQTGRTVFGGLLEILLNAFAMLLRILANVAKQTGKIIISLYDLFIAGPLWIESVIQNSRKQKSGANDDFYETEYEPLAKGKGK